MTSEAGSSRVSIIIPVLNESAWIEKILHIMQPLRAQGHEVIVVDGGSSDDTIMFAKPLADHVIRSEPGRALQMHTGALYSSGNILWFVHADTLIADDSLDLLYSALAHGHHWGRFDVRLSGRQWSLRVIERMMNLRSCLTGIATGDQGQFMTREVYDQVGGFPQIPLMEDIELSKRLRTIGRPACLHAVLVTSSRRWEQNGVFRTMLLMWRLRLLYWLGVPAEKLYLHYQSSIH